MMSFDAATLFLSGMVLLLAVLLIRQHLRARDAAEEIFERWRTREMEKARAELTRSLELSAETRLERWKLEQEARIREDSLRRSQAVVAGKTTEHLLPFFPDFPFSARDVRFLGSPVDLVVFDGMNEGRLRDIVFVEVKTGSSASLTTRERKIRDAVAAGRVRFQEIRAPGPEVEPARESFYLPLRSPDGETTGQLEVLLEAGEVRYWSDWSEPPEVYPLPPDVVVPIDGRRYAFKLASEGERAVARLTAKAAIEVDPEAGLLTFLSRRYDLETERLEWRRGALLLGLDGGR
jgi:predicted Holliday junction resolvase-like endonuclease